MGMGFGGGMINDLIDALSRGNPVSDANPMYAYRRLPQDGVTKRLPEGSREGKGAMDMRRAEPEAGYTWKSHFGSGFDPIPDYDLGFDPAEDIGPQRGDRARAAVFRDAQMSSALRMVDDMAANAQVTDAMNRAADEIDLENRAKRAGRTVPFDASVKYGNLPDTGLGPFAAVDATSELGRDWANMMLEGDPVLRDMEMRQILNTQSGERIPDRVRQAMEEQVRIRQSMRMADSVEGDTMRFERDMNRIANPPRVQGESAARMLMRGGGAMGMPALDILSLLMGAAAGRDPLDAGLDPVQFMDDRSRLALELAAVGM